MPTLTLAGTSSFYETKVLDLLGKMPFGRMELTLPDGRTLALGDGNGTIVADATINNPDFFKRVVLFGDIGFGESYVDGDWETSSVRNVIKWFLLNIEFTPGAS